jgi:hypothetical protein
MWLGMSRMKKGKTAILHLVFEAHHVVGTVEIRGDTADDDSFLAMDGYIQRDEGWILTLRVPLQKKWEDRVATATIRKLWQVAEFYGITNWIAGDGDVYKFAEPDLMTQMRRD